jgi:hypothetical protein
VHPANISVFETSIAIDGLEVDSRDVANYIRALTEDQRARAVVQAIEVGVFCLERARAGQELDFVRREVESLLSGVQSALGKMPEQTELRIIARIGTAEGQVLAPIHTLVSQVSKAASDKIDEIRTLLQEQVDPAKETSSLGKALRAVRDLLDANRADSVQGSLDAAVGRWPEKAGLLQRQCVKSLAKPSSPWRKKSPIWLRRCVAKRQPLRPFCRRRIREHRLKKKWSSSSKLGRRTLARKCNT